jgi:hypothetical protein
MKRLLRLDSRLALALVIAVDVLCVGLGMGVPIFAILWGFPAGWYLSRHVLAGRTISTTVDLAAAMRRAMSRNVWLAGATFAIMLVIWLPAVRLLFDPSVDISQFGTPLILYEPVASFIGWEVLMIVISPALQLLAGAFSAYLTFSPESRWRRERPARKQGRRGGSAK